MVRNGFGPPTVCPFFVGMCFFLQVCAPLFVLQPFWRPRPRPASSDVCRASGGRAVEDLGRWLTALSAHLARDAASDRRREVEQLRQAGAVGEAGEGGGGGGRGAWGGLGQVEVWLRTALPHSPNTIVVVFWRGYHATPCRNGRNLPWKARGFSKHTPSRLKTKNTKKKNDKRPNMSWSVGALGPCFSAFPFFGRGPAMLSSIARR